MDFQANFLYGFSPFTIAVGLTLAMIVSYIVGSKLGVSPKIDLSQNKFGPIESPILA